MGRGSRRLSDCGVWCEQSGWRSTDSTVNTQPTGHEAGVLPSLHSHIETVGLTETSVEHGQNKSDHQLRKDKQLLSDPSSAEIKPSRDKQRKQNKNSSSSNCGYNQCKKLQFILISVKINQYLIIWFCSAGSDGSFVFQWVSIEQLSNYELNILSLWISWILTDSHQWHFFNELPKLVNISHMTAK